MQQGLTMPLGRYFLFVGGTLLALLFAVNAYLPSPVVAGATVADAVRPVVRIRSTQRLPERIVIDTSIPTIVPPPAVVAEAPAKAPVLDAMAQISPSEVKGADLKKPEHKAPPKRRVAKRQIRQPMLAYAQAPPRMDFDLFARN
jgi:Flp pilus assembly protein TadB